LIFLVGAPRSGTTWLGKIFDSHPDVLYRHEPDEVLPSPTSLDEAAALSLIQAWASARSVRTAAKPPFFAKSWRTAAANLAHPLVAGLIRGASPWIGSTIPDLGDIGKASVVIKSVRWSEGIRVGTRAVPSNRTILIVRDACGHVWSMMRGMREKRFELRDGGALPIDAVAAMACAERYGVTSRQFDGLPDVARYAWGWVAFNESALTSLDGLANFKVLRYEDLCEQPEAVTRDLFAFTGLGWHAQTDGFLNRSTHYEGPSRYYGVFQDTQAVANRWRTEMHPADITAVEEIVALSPAARWCSTLPETVTVGERHVAEAESIGSTQLV